MMTCLHGQPRAACTLCRLRNVKWSKWHKINLYLLGTLGRLIYRIPLCANIEAQKYKSQGFVGVQYPRTSGSRDIIMTRVY